MPEFLRLLPPTEALQQLLEQMPPHAPQVELLHPAAALGRMVAQTILATERLPAFDRSTVDGYAVCASDTYGASESLPAYLVLTGEVPMGKAPAFTLSKGQAALIHTGGMLPPGANAVVMLEYTQSSRPAEIEILRAAAPAENVLHAGEDVEIGQEILPAGTRLAAAEIGGLLALGCTQVPVVCPPRVGILSTGDEVVPPEQTPQPGQVRDINSYSLAALVEAAGGKAVRYGILPDRAEALQAALKRALAECDAVIITAGSSASTRDLTADVIQQMGPPGVLVHGVNVKPGKPTILAVCQGKPVIGLPGNPVSALVIAGLFVVPVVQRLLGRSLELPRPQVQARLTANLPSAAGREDWVPVRLIKTPEGWLAEPIFYKSNLIFTLARADGLVKISPDATGLAVHEWVTVYL